MKEKWIQVINPTLKGKMKEKKVLSGLGTRDLHCFYFFWSRFSPLGNKNKISATHTEDLLTCIEPHPCQEAEAAGWKRLLSTIAEQAIIFTCMVKQLILSFGYFICLLFGMSKNLQRGGLTAAHIGGLMQQAVQN